MYAIIDPRDNAIIDWRDTREAAQAYARELEQSPAHPYRPYSVTLKVRSEARAFTPTEHDMAAKGYVYLSKTQSPDGLRKQIRNLDNVNRADLAFDYPAYEMARLKGSK